MTDEQSQTTNDPPSWIMAKAIGWCEGDEQPSVSDMDAASRALLALLSAGYKIVRNTNDR